jgi:hypothetical protein
VRAARRGEWAQRRVGARSFSFPVDDGKIRFERAVYIANVKSVPPYHAIAMQTMAGSLRLTLSFFILLLKGKNILFLIIRKIIKNGTLEKYRRHVMVRPPAVG